MALVWGKIAKPIRKATTEYPDTVEEIILTAEPYEGKGFNRKFSFNLHAQRELDLRKQLDPETVVNDQVIYSFDPESGAVYLGIYNKEAFAEIEKVATVTTYEIGKTTMGFATKELYLFLQKIFEFNDQSKTYFKLVPVEVEGSPIQLYTFERTFPEPTSSDETMTAEDVEESKEESFEEAPEVTPYGVNSDVSFG